MSAAVKTDSELKGLRTRRDQAICEVGIAKQKMLEVTDEYRRKKNNLDSLNARIKQLEAATNEAEIVVTEHAYLRWFERAMGFDLLEVKKQMLPPNVEALIKGSGGTCRVNTRDGFTLVVKNKSVISVMGGED